MSDIDNYSLRPEAGPIPYLKHHRRAKEAIKFIIRVLKAAADRVEESEGIANDHSIDPNRASRICFISGEPGSGKSTLYLTLRAMLSSSGEYSKGCPTETGLGNLQGVVRLLDPLDLEVAGEEGENLLAAVLVRIFQELAESSIDHSSNCEDAIKELEDLATDIGIAWGGNLQARAGALDPATYSEEVMRTQRARLGVNERLRNALNKLAEKRCYGCGPKTLFVLPVDDLYLKPDASLQLLRLLRMISIPRLFFLVMGDITTVEALFIEKSLADWTSVAGTSLFANQSARLDEALSRARELRARYLRKLLPPIQRATIEAMDWFEALDFEIGRPATSIETLEELLRRVQLDAPPTSVSTDVGHYFLLDFLISPPFTDEERENRKARAQEDISRVETIKERNRKKDRSAYSALQILDATPREMLDFGSALREVIIKQARKRKLEEAGFEAGDEDAPLLLSHVMEFVNLVREEQNFFTEDEQNILAEVTPVRHYFLEDVNFKMDRLCLNLDPWPWKKSRVGKLWIRKHRSWNLSINKEFLKSSEKKSTQSNDGQDNDQIAQAQQSPFNSLPPRPSAWIILLHDLAWTWSPDSVTGNLVKRLLEEVKSTRSVQEAGSQSNEVRVSKEEAGSKQEGDEGQEKSLDPPDNFYGWAVRHNGQTYEHLPMLDFETFQQLDHFLRVWNSGFEWREELRKKSIKLRVEAKKMKGKVATNEEKAAEAAAMENQANEIDKQVEEYLEDDNLIYLWGLAGSIVLKDEYTTFASREDNNWLAEQLGKFKDEVDNSTNGKDWSSRIKIFLKKATNIHPPPAPNS